MKITVDVECTPQEARAFFGLPDLEPLQEELVQELQRQLKRNMGLMDPETLIRSWLPTTLQGFEDMRKLFSGMLAGGARPERPAETATPAKSAAKRKKRRKSS